MASTTFSNSLPSGCAIFTSVPDLLFFPEFVFGGLVWTLVASTKVFMENPQGWVMFVSIFCFVVTTFWIVIFLTGINQKSAIWPTLDVAYHGVATALYLSASVSLAYVTILLRPTTVAPNPISLKYYHEDIAAVVMAYTATLLYALHTVFSAIRWKSS